MARFVYRLQKIYELRERRVKQQEQRVIEARRHVQEVEAAIEEKKNEIRLLRQNMLTAPHTLMSSHDDYIHKCHRDLDQLYENLETAKRKLHEETQLLVKYQSELEALEKHKEKSREAWFEEQKRLEMKQLDEVASQRFFRARETDREEALEEALQAIENGEEIDLDSLE